LRRFAYRLVPAFFLLFPLSAVAQQTPDPTKSYLPLSGVIWVMGASNGVPDPHGTFEIIVHDNDDHPIEGSTVTIDFSSCPEIVLAQGPSVDCSARTVTATTDQQGKASFTIIGSAANRKYVPADAFQCAEVRADPGNVVLGGLSVAAFDQDGTGGVDERDLALVHCDYPGGGTCLRSDYNGDFIVDIEDVITICSVIAAGQSSETPARCDGPSPSYPVLVATDGGLNLVWNACSTVLQPGSPSKTWDCSSNTGAPFRLFASMFAPSGVVGVAAIEAEIDVISSTATLPDWWRFDPGGCRASSLTLLAQQDVSSCDNPFYAAPLCSGPGYSVAYPADNDPRKERISIKFLSHFPPNPLVAGEEYGLFELAIDPAKSTGGGACTDCDKSVQIGLRSVRIIQEDCASSPGDLPTLVLQMPASSHSNVATWQAAPVRVPEARSGPDSKKLRFQPNPSISSVKIEFATQVGGGADVAIFDVSGRLVRQWREEFAAAGTRQAEWDGHDSHGRPADSGLYFVRVISNQTVITGWFVRLAY